MRIRSPILKFRLRRTDKSPRVTIPPTPINARRSPTSWVFPAFSNPTYQAIKMTKAGISDWMIAPLTARVHSIATKLASAPKIGMRTAMSE